MSDFIRDTLLEGQSKVNVNKLVKYIGDDESVFKQLMDLVLAKDDLLSPRASWVMTHCCDAQPHLIKPYFKKLVNDLKKERLHHAIKRSHLRVLQEVEIPEKYQAELYDLSLKFALSVNETIAVRVFALSTAYNIAKKHPELLNELTPLILELNRYSDSPALTSRTKFFLAEINKRTRKKT